MNGKHQDILSQKQKFPSLFIFLFKYDITLQRIKGNEHQQNIFGNVNDQFCHIFLLHSPFEMPPGKLRKC